MLILKKDEKVIDVFLGKGWDQWTRFDTSKGFPAKIGGVFMEEGDYAELLKTLYPNRKLRVK